MPKPNKPDLAPYESQLPDHNNPATWVALTTDFWTWVTGQGYLNQEQVLAYANDVAGYLDGALGGDAETILDSLNAITAEITVTPGKAEFTGDLLKFTDSDAPTGGVRFGRYDGQHVELHGSPSGNFISSVSPDGNAKDLTIKVFEGTVARNYTFSVDEPKMTIGGGTVAHSGLGASAVGQVIFAENRTGSTVNLGDSVDGTQIAPGHSGGARASAVTGTWMCIGYATNNSRTTFRRVL